MANEAKLEMGMKMPAWFWEAIKSGDIEIVGAKPGQMNTWGRDGANVRAVDGSIHAPLGSTIIRDDAGAFTVRF